MTATPGPRARGRVALASLAVFALAAPLYLATMNRGIGFIDRGELAAVATTLGIAHPTGYPTLTLIAHLVTRLAPVPPVLALNAFAALLTALGAALLVPLYVELLRHARPEGALADAEGRGLAAAACAAALVATSSVWWGQANGFEVYPLHTVLLPLALLLLSRWLRLGGVRRGMVFALVLGLSFTNHMTTVLAVPAVAALLVTDPRRGARARELPAMAGVFLLALTPYLYLPLRAAVHPGLEWNDPETLARFLNHVTAREFRSWMFADARDFAAQAGYASRLLPADVAYAGLALALAGLLRFARFAPRIALFSLLLFGACVLYACGYGIRDIDSYLLAAVLVLGAWAAAGLDALAGRVPAPAVWALGVALALANGVSHRAECDESALHLPEDLARAQLAALPPHAVLINAQWDYSLSADLYLQAVEGMRPDVTVIGQGTLRQPWYVRDLRRRDPALLAPVAAECDSFLAAVAPFEEGRRYAPARIGRWWSAMVGGAIRHAIARRPVFVTLGVEDDIGAGLARVPMGLAFQLRADTAYVPLEPPRFTYRPWRGRVDAWVATTSWIYGQLYAARAAYELQHGRIGAMKTWLGEALRFDPHIDPAHVPHQPLDGDALVAQSAGLFTQLRGAAARLLVTPPAR